MAEFDAEAYLDQALALTGLELDPAYRPGVIDNLKRSAAIAKVYLDFPLPDDVEPAATYTP